MRFGSTLLHRLVFSVVAVMLSAASFAQFPPPNCVQRQDLYRFTAAITPGGTCGIFGGSATQSFFDALTTNGLRSLPPQSPGDSTLATFYSGAQGLTIPGSYNSVPFTARFPLVGAPTLTFSAPNLGISNQTFAGATRDQSVALLQSFLTSSSVNGRLMKYQVTNSPNSPIAGPAGLIPGMVASTFNDNLNNAATHVAAPVGLVTSAGKLESQNLAGVGLSYGVLRMQDIQNDITTLPLSYTLRNDLDPRRQLVFSLPVTRVDTEGAISHTGALGVAYRVPMDDNWTVTPAAKAGMAAARDLNTVVSVASAEIVSTYIWAGEGFDVTMGNQIGYYQTTNLIGGEFSADPGVKTVSLRNGVMVTQPVHVNGQLMSLEYSLIDTRYLGTKFYVDNMQELSVTLGTNKRAFSARSFFRGGLTVTHGRDTNGLKANVGYWF